MNKIALSLLVLAATGATAEADITVNVNPAVGRNEFEVEYGYISDMTKPRMERPEANRETGKVTSGKFTLKTLPDGPAQYVIPTGNQQYIVIYTHPGDDLTVDINSTSPLDYSVTGSQLMTDISKLDMTSAKILQDYKTLMSSENPDPEAVKKTAESYDRLFKDYIAANPDAEAVPYAVMNLESEDFMTAYDAMTPAARQSPIAPLLEPQKQYVERKIAAERRMVELQSGTVEAPNFTFNDVNGKPVSLSDFLGKWVVIDFWGSWCPWCIKGFPKLKEAYAKYKPELEVIGVACNDPRDKWENALKKYELPWVNVYNPEQGGGKILEQYAVEGFPTKAIIDPEGKIKNITVGENPEFFELLEKLLTGNEK